VYTYKLVENIIDANRLIWHIFGYTIFSIFIILFCIRREITTYFERFPTFFITNTLPARAELLEGKTRPRPVQLWREIVTYTAMCKPTKAFIRSQSIFPGSVGGFVFPISVLRCKCKCRTKTAPIPPMCAAAALSTII
jgi:hypothetical protein